MIVKKAVTSVPIVELISSRWSPRAFDINRKVTQEQILAICEAGHWAPSCAGDEPWRYLVFNKHENESAYLKAFDCLTVGNQIWVKNVPVLFIACADSTFRNGTDNRWGMYDTGAASENICLEATSLGLMAHQMGGFDADKVRKEFNVPERFNIMAFIAIGYQAETDVLPEKLIPRESLERKRQTIGSAFFDGEWENPVA